MTRIVGSPRGCNQGAAAARGDVIVFLNNDTIVPAGWLEELLAPFADPEVGAVGPRSNGVSGHQLVDDVSYRGDDVTAIGEFADARRRAHRGSTSECARLVGFCLAVRAETFRAVGGFDEGYLIGGFEDDDLCMKLRHGRLPPDRRPRLVRSSRRPRHLRRERCGLGPPTASRTSAGSAEKWGSALVPPLCLLSVCLIVKDEEQLLSSCLDSVADLADEIVVYDTGSTDRTVEIARAPGRG